MATRFHLPDGTETDLLGITVPVFVASTPQEFLGLTEALRPDPATGHPDPAAVHAYVTAHPHLAAAITQQPPVPVSYGSAAFWAIHAFIWVDSTGERRPVGAGGGPCRPDRRGGSHAHGRVPDRGVP